MSSFVCFLCFVIVEIEKIKELVEDGFSASRIAAIFCVEPKVIKDIIVQNNMVLKKESFSENKIGHICVLYKNGASAKSLGQKYSIDKRRIQKWVKNEGCLRTRDESHRFALEYHKRIRSKRIRESALDDVAGE